MNPTERLVPRTAAAAFLSDAWVAAEVGELAPVVLLAGGFLTVPRWYRGLATSLLERGAAEVVHVPLYTQDWILAAVRGLGPVVTRTGRALLEASARSASSSRSLGAPILYVGHSAGGITGRLLTSPVPFDGRRTNAAGRIGALVTLGTPHVVGKGKWGRPIEEAGVRFANREVPGAFFAPLTGYVAVGSRYVVGSRDGESSRARVAYQLYLDVNGDLATPDGAPIEGDGIVPCVSALLPGARHVVVDGAVHSPGTSTDWYGRGPSIDAWWPVALEAWRDALRARQARARG
jgi:hypothetical protein